MPVIFPVIKSVLSDAVGKAIAPAQRYFLPFDPVLNSYGTPDTAFMPSGDFEVEATFSTTASGATQVVFGGSTSGSDEIRLIYVSSDNTFRANAWVGTTSQGTISTATVVTDGKLHTAKLTYTGTTAELFIDGVSQGTATWALNGNQDIGNVGRRATPTDYFDGIIADVKLTDKTTASNSRIFPLAVGAGTTENSTINTGSITINNIPDNTRELFTFDEANTQWVANDGSPTLEVG